MGDTQTQKLAFAFLLDRFHTQEPFTKEEFHQKIPGWTKNSFDTYWSKQIKRLVAPTENKSFTVTEAFRPYANWSSFRDSTLILKLICITTTIAITILV